ncbi:MAG: NAD regulator, partial [Caulobacterales bacterium]
MTPPRVVIGLSAVIVAVTEDAPFVLVTRDPQSGLTALPFGPFDPVGDRTLELSLRAWVREQTGFNIGYVEQLYTFGDRGREAPLAQPAADRVVSIGYLALTPVREDLDRPDAMWRDWYSYFPWEDWRGGRPKVIDAEIAPRLRVWADRSKERMRRARLAFALDGAGWNEERALERYELLYESGLAPEAARDRARFTDEAAPEVAPEPLAPGLGEPMASDHRRILATAMGRLRAKIKYRPVIFELTADLFTLFHLQKITESISGFEVHKQNFRRVLERTNLVEGAGQFDTSAGGRPAELFRYRRDEL